MIKIIEYIQNLYLFKSNMTLKKQFFCPLVLVHDNWHAANMIYG